MAYGLSLTRWRAVHDHLLRNQPRVKMMESAIWKRAEDKARDDDLVGLGHFDGEGEDQVEDDDERGEGVALVPELAF